MKDSLKKITVLVLLVIISFVAGYGFQYYRAQDQVSQLSQEISQLEEREQSLTLAAQGRAEETASYSEAYDFSSFGLFSPAFEGKTVQVKEYEYKGVPSVTKLLEVGDVQVRVSYLDTSRNMLPFEDKVDVDAEELAGDVPTRIPTYYGYENFQLKPIFSGERAADWERDDSFVNESGIRWFYTREFVPGGIYLHLQAAVSSTPMVRPVFVDLLLFRDTLEEPQAAEPDLSQGRAELRAVAENISSQMPR